MRRDPGSRIALYELMLLIAGAGLGFWLILPSLKEKGQIGDPGGVIGVITFTLGGLSLVGVPLLLWERRREKRPWGAGRFSWFTQGTAAWLMWPPIVYGRVRGVRSDSSVCYLYGTPLMAVFVALTLLSGGWFRKRKRKALWRSWRERFGLALALVWACLGLYLLSMFYREDFGR